jgi:hypothetical protein
MHTELLNFLIYGKNGHFSVYTVSLDSRMLYHPPFCILHICRIQTFQTYPNIHKFLSSSFKLAERKTIL